MRSGIINTITLPTINSVLNLTAVDLLFLDQLNKTEHHDEKIQLIKNADLNIIIKLAHHHPSFAALCEDIQLKEYWDELWSAYGMVLANHQSLPPVLFYSHPAVGNFNLVRGAYFFDMLQKIKINMQANFSYSEIEFLKQAIEYHSIHAIQRLDEFLHYQLSNTKAIIKDDLYNILVDNAMLALPHYASYGYMLVADACSHYAFWLLQHREVRRAEVWLDRVFEAIDYADLVLPESESTIKNASLGRGLECSNSYQFKTPEEFKAHISSRFEFAKMHVLQCFRNKL